MNESIKYDFINMIRKHVSWVIEEAHIYIQSYSSKSSNSSTCSINFQQ